ncbi:hypothetical protein B0H13DRAFT_1884793 [Mycena leptocephala]|nr:hypothetical protein B0H13DRAFT_1884793 [Mycena leptocephala]
MCDTLSTSIILGALALDQCAKDVKEIQTAMLVRIIIEERQRKLTEAIKDSQEVLGAVVLRRAYRRSESNANLFQDVQVTHALQSRGAVVAVQFDAQQESQAQAVTKLQDSSR